MVRRLKPTPEWSQSRGRLLIIYRMAGEVRRLAPAWGFRYTVSSVFSDTGGRAIMSGQDDQRDQDDEIEF